LTRFAGFFGPAMVNYVMGQILAREQRVHDMHEVQAKSQWRTPDMVG
jgi:phosphoglycerate dehydrogenase-like enzyme